MGLLPFHNEHFLIGLQFMLFVALANSLDGQCNSKACQRLVYSIESNTQLSAEACDDFYQFVCGSWINLEPIPDGDLRVTKETRRVDEVYHELKNLLQEPVAPDDTTAEKAAKQHYNACRNEKQLQAEGMKPLVDLVRENGGIWPIAASPDQKSSKTWQEVHDEYARRTGNGVLYDVLVYPELPHATNYTIVVDQIKSLAFHDVSRSDPEDLEKFIQTVKNVALKFAEATGTVVSEERVLKDAQAVADFAIAVTEIRNPESWVAGAPESTVAETQTAINNGSSVAIDLLVALEKIFSRVEGITIPAEEPIVIPEESYLEDLANLVRNTPSDVILNYIHFYYLEMGLKFTSAELRGLLPPTYGVVGEDRNVTCLASPIVQLALANMYYERYSSEQQISVVRDILQGVKNNYIAQIRRSSFLDEKSKGKLVLKLEMLGAIIGASSAFTDRAAIDRLYQKYHVGDNYFQNVFNFREVSYRERLSRLRNHNDPEVDRMDLEVVPSEYWLYYELWSNTAVIPTAVLDFPLFHLDWPPLGNYAALGVRIAEHLAEIFSEDGLMFDPYGDIFPQMTIAVSKEFRRRRQCFVDQSRNTPIKELEDAGLTFHANRTSYSSLFRSGLGLKTAFEAYQTKMALPGADLRSLGLSDVDTIQEFFLAYASSYCEALNPKELWYELQDNTYTTNRMKVNAAVSNMRMFGLAFNCQSGERMNPTERCSLFD